MIVNNCYLKDIREWEEKHQKNVLDLFENMSVGNMVLILGIFYKDISVEDACVLIDNELDSGQSLADIFIELRNSLVGYDIEKAEKKREPNEDEDVTGSFEDITQYKYLSQFYMHLCMQLMSLGMTYSEFWSLTTKEMYQAFEAIQQKMVMDYNRQMQMFYTAAGLNAAAVWGKMPKEAPHIDMNDLLDPDEIIDTPFGEMTREDYKLYKQFN